MPRQRSKIPWIVLRDGTYYVYWYDEKATPKPRTQRKSLGTADAVEAQTRYAEFLSGNHARNRTGATGGMTVSFALDDYFREHVGPHVVDKVRAENAIRHLKAWFKNTELKDVDIPASRAYADARRMGVIGGGARRKIAAGGDATIRRELVVLQAAANHELRWKRVPVAEMPSIELPHADTSGAIGDDEYLTVAEWQRTLAMATGRLLDFIVILYDTAGRRASIERLTRFQVDLARSRVNLTAPSEDTNQRRSKKRRPVVPISAFARPTYERLLAATTNEWLFGDERDMYRVFRAHMEAIGLGHKRNPHIIRHSRASHLLQAGVGLWDVAKLLGDTVATVERVYGHHSPDFLAEAIKSR